MEAGFGVPEFDSEGRTLVADYGDFLLYAVYFPNGKSSQERLDYKMRFYDAFLEHVDAQTAAGRNVVICGDVNTAHKAIDLARPKPNEKISGFLPMEREWIDTLLAHGYRDTFRMFDDGPDNYTYWDQTSRARDRNVGWRIDYFYVSSGAGRPGEERVHPAGGHGLRPLPRGHRHRGGRLAVPSVRLLHLRPMEAEERIGALRALGYDVLFDPLDTRDALKKVWAAPPDAYVFDITRVPSHMRELAIALRERVPMVFAGGDRKSPGCGRRCPTPPTVGGRGRRAGDAIAAGVAGRAGVAVRGLLGHPLPKKLGVKRG